MKFLFRILILIGISFYNINTQSKQNRNLLQVNEKTSNSSYLKMKWVTMWGNAQSTVMPSPAKYAKDLTLRYPIFSPFDGTKIRITLDNYCINERIKIDYIIVSKGNKLSDEQEKDFKYLTFKGKKKL